MIKICACVFAVVVLMALAAMVILLVGAVGKRRDWESFDQEQMEAVNEMIKRKRAGRT